MHNAAIKIRPSFRDTSHYPVVKQRLSEERKKKERNLWMRKKNKIY